MFSNTKEGSKGILFSSFLPDAINMMATLSIWRSVAAAHLDQFTVRIMNHRRQSVVHALAEVTTEPQRGQGHSAEAAGHHAREAAISSHALVEADVRKHWKYTYIGHCKTCNTSMVNNYLYLENFSCFCYFYSTLVLNWEVWQN